MYYFEVLPALTVVGVVCLTTSPFFVTRSAGQLEIIPRAKNDQQKYHRPYVWNLAGPEHKIQAPNTPDDSIPRCFSQCPPGFDYPV